MRGPTKVGLIAGAWMLHAAPFEAITRTPKPTKTAKSQKDRDKVKAARKQRQKGGA